MSSVLLNLLFSMQVFPQVSLQLHLINLPVSLWELLVISEYCSYLDLLEIGMSFRDSSISRGRSVPHPKRPLSNWSTNISIALFLIQSCIAAYIVHTHSIYLFNFKWKCFIFVVQLWYIYKSIVVSYLEISCSVISEIVFLRDVTETATESTIFWGERGILSSELIYERTIKTFYAY